MAAGNYISDTDVDNWPDAYTDSDKSDVIDRIEEQVEAITHDLFYSADFDIYRDGNGQSRLSLGLKPDILTVATIEISGVDLSSSYWTYDKNFVYRDPGDATSLVELRWLLRQYAGAGLFPRGLGNIRVIGTYGWSICPETIKTACIMLCRYDNDPTLYTRYIEGSEGFGGFQYDSKMKVLTGVFEADIILKKFVRRKPMLAVA